MPGLPCASNGQLSWSEFEVEALIGHARMLVGTKDYQKAADLLERAQSLEPQPRVARYLQAVNNLNLSARNSI
jgi:uncharacterized membrane-anchored protein